MAPCPSWLRGTRTPSPGGDQAQPDKPGARHAYPRAPPAWVCRGCGKTRMDAYPGLDAHLLVGGEDEFALAQRLPLPGTGIQTQDPPGRPEVRIARRDPGRCCQGRMASSCRQRHTVLCLMRATNRECSAERATSVTLSRDRDRPGVAGNSQAGALISTVSPGAGKPWAGALLPPRQSLPE